MKSFEQTKSSDFGNGTLSKSEGSFYTPRPIAEAILDMAGYVVGNQAILNADIIDPSCGDGAILVPAVERFIEASFAAGSSPAETAAGIIKHFHAYELNADELAKCRDNICRASRSHGVVISAECLARFKVGDSLKLFKTDLGSMDFVVGNPPYVRIHNLDEKPESCYIDGMCDLYYAFYDLGQQLLKKDGVLCFISPSSWFTARAGKLMREDLAARRAISAVCDFGHRQLFAPYATTYTAIVKITAAAGNDSIDVYCQDDNGAAVFSERVTQDSCWTNGLFLPGAPSWIASALSAKGTIRVLNGCATYLDEMFVSSTPRFSGSSIEKRAVKASRGDARYVLYPYDKEGNLLSFDEIAAASPLAAELMRSNEDVLKNRSQVPSESWWRFGRSQGIAHTFSDKVSIQSLVKPGNPVRCMDAPAGTAVYGGVFVLGMDTERVTEAANSSEFMAYAATLRKYKSGGYYALSGKEIQSFLNWWAASQLKSSKSREMADASDPWLANELALAA